MAIREIVKLGSEVLREKAKPVDTFDEKLSQLIDDMFDTMFKADGVGLAAPQVGILRRVCVVSVDGGKTKYELINPVIEKASGRQCGVEGCLSCPGRSGAVVRPKKLTVRFCDRTGKEQLLKVDGFTAVAFCHEIDHLDGVLFIDKTVGEEE
ncbi:MAG: peptide deformylase [Clostridiales bacterium]|nr:peptide deformylase [Clostridiales bacterium]